MAVCGESGVGAKSLRSGRAQFSALEVSFPLVLTHELHGQGQRSFLPNRPLSRGLSTSSQPSPPSSDLHDAFSNPWLLKGGFLVRLVHLELKAGPRGTTSTGDRFCLDSSDIIQGEAALGRHCLPLTLITVFGRVQSSSHK